MSLFIVLHIWKMHAGVQIRILWEVTGHNKVQQLRGAPHRARAAIWDRGAARGGLAKIRLAACIRWPREWHPSRRRRSVAVCFLMSSLFFYMLAWSRISQHIFVLIFVGNLWIVWGASRYCQRKRCCKWGRKASVCSMQRDRRSDYSQTVAIRFLPDKIHRISAVVSLQSGHWTTEKAGSGFVIPLLCGAFPTFQ